jgi:ubiquinone/menaquinone biosynthesis C-methylase UbiE
MKGVVEAFDQHAEDYDRWFDTPEGQILFKIEVDAVRLLMKDLKRPFLEIGVGTGRFAKELGIDTGIDLSLKLMEIAKKRGIAVEKAKGESLPFRDKSFGTVFILFTLCFIEDPEMVLFEAKRVLKIGGRLIIGIINKESSWGQLYLQKKAEGHPIYRYATFYTVYEVVKMIEHAGMTVEAYSSTLCQPPHEILHEEAAYNELNKKAGFVCILARKIQS